MAIKKMTIRKSAIKKVVNQKVIFFDFCLDILEITNNKLLSCLCTECHLEELFIEIYTVEKNETSLFQRLSQLDFDTVYIPYKNGKQDVAIKMDAGKLPVLFSTLSGYVFGEMTIWDANERWEQHLFSKSAHKGIYVENEHRLYLCYNLSEKRVELYLDPSYDAEKIHHLIKESSV